MHFTTLLALLPALTQARSVSIVARDSTSDNWCGTILTGKDIKTAEATWTVPTARLPAGGSKTTHYENSQWVGIDGDDSCAGALLQGGTSATVRITFSIAASWQKLTYLVLDRQWRCVLLCLVRVLPRRADDINYPYRFVSQNPAPLSCLHNKK